MLLYKELSDKILRAYFNVMKNLGVGFLESVYENAVVRKSPKRKKSEKVRCSPLQKKVRCSPLPQKSPLYSAAKNKNSQML